MENFAQSLTTLLLTGLGGAVQSEKASCQWAFLAPCAAHCPLFTPVSPSNE